MRIFIAGGGDERDSALLDREFALCVQGQPVLYLPIANEGLSLEVERHYEWICRVLRPLGVRDIVMWDSLWGKSHEELESFGGIYIGGGNLSATPPSEDVRV